MSDLKINIDVDALAKQLGDYATEVKDALQKGVSGLAAMTHAKVIEMANNELHSTRKNFMDSLGFEEISPGVWVVSVSEKGLFVEEGIEENFDMKPGLLKNATKTSKDGFKYRSIPFEHGKAPSQSSGYAQNLTARIKYNLKKEGIPFKKIEKNADGSPRVGKLHTLDFGGEVPGKGNTPVLKGVSIYQSVTKTGNVRRDILTFRTVSDGPKGQGKWIHPGKEPKKFLDRVLTWAENEWEQNILPDILSKYK